MPYVPVDPPPFFHRGPSPLARLAFFGLVSLVLLFADTRYRYLENIRQVVGIVLYPVQRAVQLPGEAMAQVGAYFASQRGLASDVASLKQELLQQAPSMQSYPLIERENAQLRALLAVQARVRGSGTGAEVMYSGRDPFSQKIFIDKGESGGVQAGQAAMGGKRGLGPVTPTFSPNGGVAPVTGEDHPAPGQGSCPGGRCLLYGAGAGRPPRPR